MGIRGTAVLCMADKLPIDIHITVFHGDHITRDTGYSFGPMRLVEIAVRREQKFDVITLGNLFGVLVGHKHTIGQ